MCKYIQLNETHGILFFQGRNIKASLTATSVFYNGVKAEPVKKIEGKMFVGPKKCNYSYLQVPIVYVGTQVLSL